MTRYGWRTREDGQIMIWDLPNGAEHAPTLSLGLRPGLDAVEARWGDKCRAHGSAHGLPDGLLQAHVWRESAGNPRAFRVERHTDGTPIIEKSGRPLTGVGLGQITSGSLKGHHTDEELFDPDLNLEISAAYLGNLWKQYSGDFPRVSAAYNAGSVRADDSNPWNMHQTSGHVSAEVAAYNYWLSRWGAKPDLTDAERTETLAEVAASLQVTGREAAEEAEANLNRTRVPDGDAVSTNSNTERASS